MEIEGIQKLTLIDYPGNLACTLFIHGCNFKCGFCHNPELVVKPAEKNYSEEEILDFLRKRKKYLEGVCITGGEPLINLDKNVLRKIRELGYLIKIDTNGSFPEKLKELIDEKLVDYIAMDIKSGKEKYNEVVGVNVDLNKIEESIRMICGFGEYEFRTTVLREFHDKEEMKKIGEWLNEICKKKPKKYFLQGFKNKGKFVDSSYKVKKDLEKEYLNKLKGIAEDYFEIVEVRV